MNTGPQPPVLAPSWHPSHPTPDRSDRIVIRAGGLAVEILLECQDGPPGIGPRVVGTIDAPPGATFKIERAAARRAPVIWLHRDRRPKADRPVSSRPGLPLGGTLPVGVRKPKRKRVTPSDERREAARKAAGLPLAGSVAPLGPPIRRSAGRGVAGVVGGLVDGPGGGRD